MKPSEIEITKRIETNTFKGTFKASKAKIIQRVCQTHTTLKDNYEGHFFSSFYIYLPKLTPKYLKPSIMLTIATGKGSLTIRTDNLESLKKCLTILINFLNSDIVRELWERLQTISEQLNDNSILVLDEKFIDKKAFNKIEIQD